MWREIRNLCSWLGRAVREALRKGGKVTSALKSKTEIAQRRCGQLRDSKNKQHALHVPGVGCIAKPKARTPYKFGVKASVAVTSKDGRVVSMRSMPRTHCDGHTVESQIEQIVVLTGVTPKMALVDRG